MEKGKASIVGRIVAFIVIVFFLSLSYLRVFDDFEYNTLDFRYMLRPIQPVNKDIAIIHISDDTITQLGDWPIPRRNHALLISALKSAGVKLIVMDIFFSEKTGDDQMLADAAREAGNVYLPYVLDVSGKTPDDRCFTASGFAAPLLPELESAAKGTGFVNVLPDRDGKVRHVTPFIEYKGKYYPHITFSAVLQEMGTSFDKVEIVPGKYMKLEKGRIVPLEENSTMLVNYPGPWVQTFRHYSYIDIIQSYLAQTLGQPSIIDLQGLKGSVCYVGFTATASPDAHPSPIEPVYPGVGVHASLYNGLMNNSFIIRLDRIWNIVALVFLWILTGAIAVRAHRKKAFIYVFVAIAGYLIFSIALFSFFGVWIDMFYPVTSAICVYGVLTFQRYLDETRKRELLEKELNIAKNIQQSFLPVEIPKTGGLDIAVEMKTARQVGGDLYDIVELDNEKLGVMIGDVSGKGVPAALFMAKVVSVFKSFVKGGACNEVVKSVNERLIIESNSNLFVTLTYMIFDTAKRTVSFSIGGHLPTIVVSRDGNVRIFAGEEGTPLGLMEGDFSREEFTYDEGDLILLYTDGVTEAMTVRNEMFEEKRLIDLAKTLTGRSAAEVVTAIHKKITEFAGKAEQHDDITVLAIRT